MVLDNNDVREAVVDEGSNVNELVTIASPEEVAMVEVSDMTTEEDSGTSVLATKPVETMSVLEVYGVLEL